MSYIVPKPIADYPWPVRWVLKRQIRVYGEVLSPSYLWGRFFGLFFGVLGLLGVFSRQRFPISKSMRSLVSIRVAQLNGCAFCVDLNAHHYLASKGEASKAQAVMDWRHQKEHFTPMEQAILAFAELMTTECAKIDQTVIDALKVHLSDDEITGLAAWIAFQNMSAKFNAALGAESHGFCKRPQ